MNDRPEGTNHFPSMGHAVSYYRPQNFNREDIKKKIAANEIEIGKPPAKKGFTLRVIDNRYHYEKH